MPTPIKGSISGSTGASILGLNEYESPFSRWQKLLEDIEPGFNSLNGYVLPEFEENASIRFGNCFESAAIQLTEEKLGRSITDLERVFQMPVQVASKSPSPAFMPLSCHVDGLIQPRTLYEGKTTAAFAYRNKWGEPGTDKIPRSYQIQVQHNMYLSDTEEAVVSCLVFPEAPQTWEDMGWEVDGDEETAYYLYNKDRYGMSAFSPDKWATVLDWMGYHHIYRIKRNDDLISLMLEKYREFWESYVLPKLPPEPMNIDDLKRLCPEPKGTIIVEDAQLLDALQEYKSIGEEIGKGGKLEKRREQLKTLFIDGARKLHAEMDDESTDKWIFRDAQGKRLASWGKNAKGSYTFR